MAKDSHQPSVLEPLTVIFASSDGNLEFYRIPGVLQRFGVCYLFVAMMQLLLSPMDNKEKKVNEKRYFRSSRCRK